jgi:hypothetical protein
VRDRGGLARPGADHAPPGAGLHPALAVAAGSGCRSSSARSFTGRRWPGPGPRVRRRHGGRRDPDARLVDELHRHKSATSTASSATASARGRPDGHDLDRRRRRGLPARAAAPRPTRCPGMKREGAYRHVRSPTASRCTSGRSTPTRTVDDLELVKQANPAPWQTIEVLRERIRLAVDDAVAVGAVRLRRVGTRCAARVRRDLVGVAREAWQEIEAWPLVTLGLTVPAAGTRRPWWRRCETGIRCLSSGVGAPGPNADDDWEVPEDEVDQLVAYAFETWDVWRLYADPPYWESASIAGPASTARSGSCAGGRTASSRRRRRLRAWQNDMRPACSPMTATSC